MATPGSTIGDRITDIIGSEYATIPSLSYKDMINSAFNEVADMISEDLLLKHSKTPGILEANTEWLVEDRKILNVTRVDADSSGIERECTEVDRIIFAASQDSNSIHYATAHSPIYHFDTANDGAATLKIIPVPTTPQKGRIWYFSYAVYNTDLTGITFATLNSAHYMPSNTIRSIVLKSCINILQSYISDFIQDEEDQEMVQMIQAQLQGLKVEFQQEITRFMVKTEEPGAE